MELQLARYNSRNDLQQYCSKDDRDWIRRNGPIKTQARAVVHPLIPWSPPQQEVSAASRPEVSGKLDGLIPIFLRDPELGFRPGTRLKLTITPEMSERILLLVLIMRGYRLLFCLAQLPRSGLPVVFRDDAFNPWRKIELQISRQ